MSIRLRWLVPVSSMDRGPDRLIAHLMPAPVKGADGRWLMDFAQCGKAVTPAFGRAVRGARHCVKCEAKK